MDVSFEFYAWYWCMSIFLIGWVIWHFTITEVWKDWIDLYKGIKKYIKKRRNKK